MNNSKTANETQPHERSASERISHSQIRHRSPTDEVIRDFFRRGDGGQYEGGPADYTFDNLPALDLPERPAIVRTPRQQARRIALMRIEAVMLTGCVVLLVAASRVNSSYSSEPSRVNAAQIPAQHAARSVAQPVAEARSSKIHTRVSASDRAMVDAPKPTRSAQAPTPSPTPQVVELPKASPIANSPIATASTQQGSRVRSAVHETASSSAGHHGLGQSTQLAAMPNQASATPSIAPKRAVAAFPDD